MNPFEWLTPKTILAAAVFVSCLMRVLILVGGALARAYT